MVIHINLGFHLFFLDLVVVFVCVWLSSFHVWLLSSQCLFVRKIQTNKKYSIRNNKSNNGCQYAIEMKSCVF